MIQKNSDRDVDYVCEHLGDIGKQRFSKTYCSQCGGEFGPGNSGFSHCESHRGVSNAMPEHLAEWLAGCRKKR